MILLQVFNKVRYRSRRIGAYRIVTEGDCTSEILHTRMSCGHETCDMEGGFTLPSEPVLLFYTMHRKWAANTHTNRHQWKLLRWADLFQLQVSSKLFLYYSYHYLRLPKINHRLWMSIKRFCWLLTGNCQRDVDEDSNLVGYYVLLTGKEGRTFRKGATPSSSLPSMVNYLTLLLD